MTLALTPWPIAYQVEGLSCMYDKDGYQLSGTVAPQEEMGNGPETVPTVCVTGEKAEFVQHEE